MKLIHADLQNMIIFEENKVNLLIIENKKYYIKIIEEFVKQIEGNSGNFSLFSEQKELKISERVEIIKDIFNLEINNKKVTNKIYSELEELAFNSENLIETKQIESELLKYLYTLIEKYEYSLELQEEFDLKSLWKLFSITLSSSFSNKLEEIIEYIEIISKILKKDIFVLVNFHTFFEKSQLEELYKHCFYKKINLLLAENQKSDIILDIEKLFIIDNDLCEIIVDK